MLKDFTFWMLFVAIALVALIGCETSSPIIGSVEIDASASQGDASLMLPTDQAVDLADTAMVRCGNGVLEGTETCDDGNLDNGDGCDVNCTPTACGNLGRPEGWD